MNTYSQTKGGGPTARHTQIHWAIGNTGSNVVNATHGRVLFECHNDERAAFIVTACNSYESSQRRIAELEGALRGAAEKTEDNEDRLRRLGHTAFANALLGITTSIRTALLPKP